MTETNTPSARDDFGSPKRTHLAQELTRLLPELRDRSSIVEQVTGKGFHRNEYANNEELQAVLDAVPAFIAERDAPALAEAAKRAEDAVLPATKRLTAMAQAIRDGAPVPAADFAKARAEAQAEEAATAIAAEGAKARAKAETAAAKKRNAAKDAVRQNPPTVSADLPAAIDAANQAIDVVIGIIRDYAEQIDAAKRTLAQADVQEYGYNGHTPTDAFDPNLHGFQYENAISLDGTILDGATLHTHLRTLADRSTPGTKTAAA